jgi:hypothetical protein
VYNYGGHYTCIVPICHQLHWTLLLIRKSAGDSWKIFFVNSMKQGTDSQFAYSKALFHTTDLFTGEWTQCKIIQQTELECGARVCLHGLCFALSNQNSSRIMNSINRISNLAACSRTMVSRICNDGQWTMDNARLAQDNHHHTVSTISTRCNIYLARLFRLLQIILNFFIFSYANMLKI